MRIELWFPFGPCSSSCHLFWSTEQISLYLPKICRHSKAVLKEKSFFLFSWKDNAALTQSNRSTAKQGCSSSSLHGVLLWLWECVGDVIQSCVQRRNSCSREGEFHTLQSLLQSVIKDSLMGLSWNKDLNGWIAARRITVLYVFKKINKWTNGQMPCLYSLGLYWDTDVYIQSKFQAYLMAWQGVMVLNKVLL